MANFKINFLSVNVGLKSNLAGLNTLICAHNLDLIFLQEVRISESQIEQIVGRGFKCKVNIDDDSSSKPGTAIIWKEYLPVTEVSVIVPSRAQCLVLGNCGFLNIYAPSGSDKRNERALFFSRDIFRAFFLHSDVS